MKKILSFVLVLAMIASMMCVNAAAFDQYIVGGLTDGKRVGEASFAAHSSSTNIEASVGTTVNHRYSVELEYNVSNIAINGDVTWDTQEMKYVADSLEITVGEDTTPVTMTGTAATFDVGSCTVTNYSDLAIVIDAEVSFSATTKVSSAFVLNSTEDTVGASANADLLADDVSVTVADAYDETGASETGSAKSTSYTVSLSSDNWANVAKDLEVAGAETSAVVIATYTVKVAPAN